MPITEEQIASLKAANPGAELTLVSNAEVGMDIVVRVPSEGEWTRFRTQQGDEALRPMALRTLILACIVQPPATEFMGILAQRPGLAETFGADVVAIAGVSRASTRRKL